MRIMNNKILRVNFLVMEMKTASPWNARVTMQLYFRSSIINTLYQVVLCSKTCKFITARVLCFSTNVSFWLWFMLVHSVCTSPPDDASARSSSCSLKGHVRTGISQFWLTSVQKTCLACLPKSLIQTFTCLGLSILKTVVMFNKNKNKAIKGVFAEQVLWGFV